MSNNLALSQVAAAQNNKEVTINDQAGQLDAALTEVLTVEVDDSNAYVLRRHFFIVVTEGSPAPTAAITLQVPAIRRGLFKLLNLTNQTVAIEVSGQSESAPQIPAGENRMLSCDGSEVRAAGIGTPDLGGASIGELLDVDISGIAIGQQLAWNGSALVPVTEPFDVGVHLPDLSTAGALLAEIVLARPVDFPAASAGSTGYARIAATAETVLDVQKNGSNVGTVTFAAASSTPVFALPSATSFAVGDRLGIVNDDPADATLAGVSLTYDVAGATVEDNTLWGGKCILFDNGPRLRVEDDPAIENADRITVEAWVNTLSWPTRAVVCRKDGSYILYNYSGGFSWYLFGPDNRLQYDIAGTLGNGAWGYIVGTYDKDAGTNNQRLYLNGARVAQMSDTLPIDLNSAALGIGRHVSGIADPFNGHIDEFRIAHVQRSDGWIATTWNNMSDPDAFAAAGAEEQEGGDPPPLAGAGVVVCLMG